jgi:TRAP-type C4-dicarboxylate transport system permease small subunit
MGTNTIAGDISFLDVLFAIIISWILVTLWQRFVDNLLYDTLGLNQKSTYQSLVVAVAFTIIFIAFINLFHNMIHHAPNADIMNPIESVPVDSDDES